MAPRFAADPGIRGGAPTRGAPTGSDGPAIRSRSGHPVRGTQEGCLYGVSTGGGIFETGAMFDPDKHHRRSLRLRGHDYSQAGHYYVTVCVQDRSHRFGEVIDAKMHLNAAGLMVQRIWGSLPFRFPTVGLDTFIVMPNHVHGILELRPDENPGSVPPRPTLGIVVGAFKSIATVEYIESMQAGAWPPFDGRLLQRNYFEHVIRDEVSLENIRNYILDNPARWHRDKHDPEANGM